MAVKSQIADRKSQVSYDVHTHVGLDTAFYLAGWWPYSATVQDLIEHMDFGRIDRAVCFPFCVSSAYDLEAFLRDRSIRVLPGRAPYDRENVMLVTECERLDQDKRMLPFAMFDPLREVPAQLRNLDTLLGRIAGLKTQTTVGQAPIRKLLDESRDLMHFAAQHDLPVVVHTSVAPDDPWAQVRDCLAVAEGHPKVRFNLAHTLRFDRESLRRAAAMPNVWVDCAAHLNHCALARIKSPSVILGKGGLDADFNKPADVLAAAHDILGAKYLWGSDNPFQSWCDDTIRLVHAYSAEIDALRAAPRKVQDDMLTVGPTAWLGRSAQSRDQATKRRS